MSNATRICKKCGEEQDIVCFRIQRGYRIHVCNSCIAIRNESRRACERNQAFNQLVRWPAP